MHKILITGASGLVGSEAVNFYTERGNFVIGIDNDMRAIFFGDEASTKNHISKHKLYSHFDIDIRECEEIFKNNKIDVVIHTAGAPSHDWAASNPILDFDINATGTLKLLESCRKFSPNAVFVYLSTNKVYGDIPNRTVLLELPTRYEALFYEELSAGFSEQVGVDNCMHSLFGVSKLSGDLMVQEYGRYFGMKTVAFRCGCITGSHHAGVELHGFLSYMVKCYKEKKPYKIYGYKGKQVRDNIHAYDLVTAIDAFIQSPRPGEVYNMGGSRFSNTSVLEAIQRLNIGYEYDDRPRKGDHQWYISDVSKFRSHYPKWEYKFNIDAIFEDLMK